MTLRFYISSIISNAIVVFLTFEAFEFLIEEIVMYNTYSKLLAKLSVISDLSTTYFFYGFLFWLLSPLTILVLKKYKYHWVAFVVLNTFIATFYFFYHFNKLIWERNLYETLFLMIVGFSISILIHFLQKLIGIKLLPTLYKPNVG